jgi:hypothetical protein
MSENAKTITFVAIGLCAILLGLASAPSSAEVEDAALSGTNLTKGFTDPDAAKKLRIVRFNEETGKPREFNVAEQENGLWAIPSKDNYPADATRQMAEASTSMMDRKILRVASRNASDHEQYGVIDPMAPKLEAGQKGVGTRVTMSDAQGKPLADLIVGKAVRDAEGQRYVREAGRDVVYVVEIDPSKMSTSFEDWIEKDLLKLEAWNMQQVDIKDYSARLVRGLTPDGRLVVGIDRQDNADMTVSYSDGDAQWKPVKLQKWESPDGKDGSYVEFKLADDEELNNETLTALKNALDDLKIVDVARKPAGLSKDLKAGAEFLNSDEALIDLMKKGFACRPPQDGNPGEIECSDGEVVATMKNGVEYVLRFGNLTEVDGGSDKDAGDEKSEDKAGGEKKPGKSDVNRYLFVMARFNKDAVKMPELAKLPDLPAGAEEKTEAKTEAEPPKEGAEKKDEVAGEKKDEAKAEEKDANAGDEKGKAEEKADAAKEGEDAKKEEGKEAKPESELDKVIAERKKLEAENQQKLKEYQDQLAKGEQAVKDLNLRFGDWYFVVGDDVFQKVRVGRDKLIKKKDAKEGGAAAPAGLPPGVIPGLPGGLPK